MEHRYQQANQMNLDVAGMAMIDMKKLQAQMAVMAELLTRAKWTAEIVEAEGLDSTQAFRVEIDEALQSAPTVLYAGEARVVFTGLLQKETSLYFANGETVRLPGGTGSGYAGIGKVIVLEGTNALQEQSKAELPDECLPKGGQGQNSEQEESDE